MNWRKIGFSGYLDLRPLEIYRWKNGTVHNVSESSFYIISCESQLRALIWAEFLSKQLNTMKPKSWPIVLEEWVESEEDLSIKKL